MILVTSSRMETPMTITKPARNSWRYFLTGMLILVLGQGMALAVEVDGLYEAEVAVETQGRQERQAAIIAAFQQVLLKVAGRSDVNQIEAVSQLRQQAVSMVQQYRYLSRPLDRPDKKTQDYLWVRFDTAAVNKALWDRGVPVWGKARPTVLVWLAVEDGSRRFLLGSNSADEYRVLLEQLAGGRGLPVFFPLLDLEDQARLKFSDVWGNFQTSIEQASERYGTEAILVGRLLRENADWWQARWTLYHGNQVINWDRRGDLNAGMNIGIQSSADIIAARSAQLTGGGEQLVQLQVNDINSLEAYAATLDYLASLGPVAEIDVAQANPASILCRLRIRGQREALVQALALSGRRLLVPVASSPDKASDVLVYRFTN
jgi:hypothetical protein